MERLECWVLMGPPEGIDLTGSGYDPQAHRAVEENFVTYEEAFARELQNRGFSGRAPDEVDAQTLFLIAGPIAEACQRAGLHPAMFGGITKEFLLEFLADLPVEFAMCELRRLQHQNPGRSWRKSDLYDLHALSMAVVHCDVVVAERHWSHMMKRAGLDLRNETVVLTDIRDLGKHILA